MSIKFEGKQNSKYIENDRNIPRFHQSSVYNINYNQLFILKKFFL